MDTTLLIILAIAILFFLGVLVFFWGMWVGVKCALPDNDSSLYLHCYQCEIEMPVKEKNGNLYCENCGLLHTNDYV